VLERVRVSPESCQEGKNYKVEVSYSNKGKNKLDYYASDTRCRILPCGNCELL
jgi:hypothetical protein